MKSAVLFSAAVLVASVAGLTVNTPGNVVECEPTAITWTDGTAPYYLSLNLQTDPDGDAQQTYGPLESSPFTWTTNITSGTTLVVTLKDSTGTTAQSGGFTIASGSSSCLTSSGSSSAASGSSSSAAGASSSSAASASTTAVSSSGASSATGASSGSSSATSAASSGSASGTSTGAASETSTSGSTSSGALANAVNVLAAGALGAGVIAFLA
ncbi:hypothetical protein DAEQUDRAFT_748841 [Daedalea quercina L-15889]|uniref:Uncharacterized protein n=1 Tax=Daedalea quercina L-15889 TaxID=1314783 RepID=A0A165TMZ3_9APHY|nr:hypothetical protein DAEQUDRAFT_748841 [Daedalea quercina L-15889]